MKENADFFLLEILYLHQYHSCVSQDKILRKLHPMLDSSLHWKHLLMAKVLCWSFRSIGLILWKTMKISFDATHNAWTWMCQFHSPQRSEPQSNVVMYIQRQQCFTAFDMFLDTFMEACAAIREKKINRAQYDIISW